MLCVIGVYCVILYLHTLMNMHYMLIARGDRSPGTSTVFVNPESRDWRRPNPGISGLQKDLLNNTFNTIRQ